MELMLNCSTTYEFQARAWNELGGGDLSSSQSQRTDDFIIFRRMIGYHGIDNSSMCMMHDPRSR